MGLVGRSETLEAAVGCLGAAGAGRWAQPSRVMELHPVEGEVDVGSVGLDHDAAVAVFDQVFAAAALVLEEEGAEEA